MTLVTPRRATALRMRRDGAKFREIGEALGVTTSRAASLYWSALGGQVDTLLLIAYRVGRLQARWIVLNHVEPVVPSCGDHVTRRAAIDRYEKKASAPTSSS